MLEGFMESLHNRIKKLFYKLKEALMAIVDVCIFPIGEGSSVSKYVAQCEKILEKSDLKHQLSPMSTTIEGDLDEIFKVIREMQESVFDKGAGRVYSVIKVDDRRDKEASFEQKIDSVKSKM